MRGILRLTLVVLLGSLIACHSTKLEGHYEGTRLDFDQDEGAGGPAAIDLEPTGSCLYSDHSRGKYSDHSRGKRPCHWERSTGGITVHLTDGESLPFQWAGGKLSHLERDGTGGGICIELVKDAAVRGAEAGICRGVMMGPPLHPSPTWPTPPPPPPPPPR